MGTSTGTAKTIRPLHAELALGKAGPPGEHCRAVLTRGSDGTMCCEAESLSCVPAELLRASRRVRGDHNVDDRGLAGGELLVERRPDLLRPLAEEAHAAECLGKLLVVRVRRIGARLRCQWIR